MKLKKILNIITALIIAVTVILLVVCIIINIKRNQPPEPSGKISTSDTTVNDEVPVPLITPVAPITTESKTAETTEKPSLDVGELTRNPKPYVSDVTVEYTTKELPHE